MSLQPLPHRLFPCRECPWRRDTPAGQFPACRYEQLENTSGRPGAEVGLDAPLFACHKTAEGREQACAGWLAVVGREHLGVRLAVATGRLPATALDPAEGWPALFDSYTEMAAVQGATSDPIRKGSDHGRSR